MAAVIQAFNLIPIDCRWGGGVLDEEEVWGLEGIFNPGEMAGGRRNCCSSHHDSFV